MNKEKSGFTNSLNIQVPLKVVELERGNIHLIMKVVFGEDEPANWIIDTGASKTVFDKNLTSFYSLTNDQTEELHSAGIAQQPLEVSTGILNAFKAGNVKFNVGRIALLDLSHINKFYQKTVNLQVCGLIGGDFLMKYQSIIDYRNKVISFYITP